MILSTLETLVIGPNGDFPNHDFDFASHAQQASVFESKILLP